MVHFEGSNIAFAPQFARDIENVFLDARVFARIHNIDGYEVRCVIVSDNSVQPTSTPDGQVITGAGIVIYASRDDVSGFAENQPIRVDGELYTVNEVRNIQGGLWRVKCVSNYV